MSKKKKRKAILRGLGGSRFTVSVENDPYARAGSDAKRYCVSAKHDRGTWCFRTRSEAAAHIRAVRKALPRR